MRVLAVLGAFLALAAAGAAAVRTARVTITSTNPVVVHGNGFVSAERVTVTVFAKTSRTRVVTASSAGAFVVRFRHFAIGRCSAYGVRAKGNKGSLVTWKITPMCAPSTGPTSTEPPPLFPNDPTPKKKP